MGVCTSCCDKRYKEDDINMSDFERKFRESNIIKQFFKHAIWSRIVKALIERDKIKLN